MMNATEIHEEVQERYGKIAQTDGGCCCSCGTADPMVGKVARFAARLPYIRGRVASVVSLKVAAAKPAS